MSKYEFNAKRWGNDRDRAQLLNSKSPFALSMSLNFHVSKEGYEFWKGVDDEYKKYLSK